MLMAGYGVEYGLVKQRLPKSKRRSNLLKNERSMSLPGLGESSDAVMARARHAYGMPGNKLASHVAALTRECPFPKLSDVLEYCKVNGVDEAELSAAVFGDVQGEAASQACGDRKPLRRTSLPSMPARRILAQEERCSCHSVQTFDEQLSGWSSLDFEEGQRGAEPVPTFNVGIGTNFDAHSIVHGSVGSERPLFRGKSGQRSGNRRSALVSLNIEKIEQEGIRKREGSYFNINRGRGGSRKCLMGAEQLVGKLR